MLPVVVVVVVDAVVVSMLSVPQSCPFNVFSHVTLNAMQQTSQSMVRTSTLHWHEHSNHRAR